jgi:hypothetical protein
VSHLEVNNTKAGHGQQTHDALHRVFVGHVLLWYCFLLPFENIVPEVCLFNGACLDTFVTACKQVCMAAATLMHHKEVFNDCVSTTKNL